jgi:hypothetical protein
VGLGALHGFRVATEGAYGVAVLASDVQNGHLVLHRSPTQLATSPSYMRYGHVTKENEMRNKLAIAALAVLVSGPMVAPAPAFARSYDRDHRVYHGHDGRYRHRCGGGNGAVGTIAGGAGGALLGNAVGGGTLGTVAGGVGGALLGRHLDKKHTESRRGC